jgi:putative transposase
MSAAMTAHLVTDSLVMAIWRRGKPDVVPHHSDRGSQYSSESSRIVGRWMSRSGSV